MSVEILMGDRWKNVSRYQIDCDDIQSELAQGLDCRMETKYTWDEILLFLVYRCQNERLVIFTVCSQSYQTITGKLENTNKTHISAFLETFQHYNN